MVTWSLPKPPVVPAAGSGAAKIMERQGHKFYVIWYRKGWRDSGRLGEIPAWADALPTDAHNAWMDGYLDNATGRDPWHLTECKNHGYGEGGCKQA
jgi:hypothetical protein